MDETEPASFQDAAFLRALERDTRDMHYVRATVVDEYNKATGNKLSLNLQSDDPALRDVVRWLNGLDHFGFMHRTPRLEHLVYSSMSNKLSAIAQWHCNFCNTGFPSVVLPIRIKPLSYQSTPPKIRIAFKRALKEWLASKHRFEGQPVCVHITIAVGRSSRISDVDNIAKLFLDGLKGTLFRDDKQVEHLSVARVRTSDDEDFAYVRVAPTRLNELDDMLFSKTDQLWAVGDAIDLAKYLDAKA